MARDYAWEKFHTAVIGLASSRQSLQMRLADAYRFHLLHIEDEDLPQEITEDFKRLAQALRARKAKGDEGDAVASSMALSEGQAGDLIELIVSMYDRVAKYGPNGRD